MLPSMYNRDADISAIRKRQIDTLKAFNEKVTTIVENKEYKVEFTTPAGTMCLDITLPHDFPKEKPLITVKPLVAHPWVSNEGTITDAPGILNFTMHSDLGRVTNAIIREWQSRPPQIHHSASQQLKDVSVSAGSGSDFPGLSNLSASTLQSIGTNTDRLEEFVSTLPHWRTWDKAVQDKIAEIEKIARENLSKEADLTELKKQVSEKASEAQELKRDCEERVREYERLSEPYEPERIRDALQDAAKESDVAAEDIAERFLAGDLDVDHFLLEYVEIRKISQLRKTKEEKLGKQILELHKAGF